MAKTSKKRPGSKSKRLKIKGEIKTNVKKTTARLTAQGAATTPDTVLGTCTVTSPLGITTTSDNYTEARCKAAASAVGGTYNFDLYK